MTVTLTRHPLGLTWVEDDPMARAAHAVTAAGSVWLIDPFEDEAALGAAAELGRVAGVIQLLDRHNRDCGAIAQRLEVPRLTVPASVPGSPFAVIPVISRRWWREIALWFEQELTLIVAEAVGTAEAFAVGRRLGVHPLLRLVPPRAALGPTDPERLLVGHGPPLQSGAGGALAEALAASREDIPRLLAMVPGLIRHRPRD
jgi:hypothetical protein